MNLTHSCRSSLTSSIKLTPRWRLKHPRKSAISMTTYSLFKKESMVLKNRFPFFHVYFFDQHYSNSPIPFPSCNSFRIFIVSASLYRHTVLHVQHMLTYNYTSGWVFFFCSNLCSTQLLPLPSWNLKTCLQNFSFSNPISFCHYSILVVSIHHHSSCPVLQRKNSPIVRVILWCVEIPQLIPCSDTDFLNYSGQLTWTFGALVMSPVNRL